MFRPRAAAFALFAATAISACDRTHQGVGAPAAQADPTTAPSAQSSPAAFPPEKIDTLLLSQDEVQKILGEGSIQLTETESDGDRIPSSGYPRSHEPGDYQELADGVSPHQCYIPYFATGNIQVIGHKWSAFRLRELSGSSNSKVEQAVTVYSDSAAAQVAVKNVVEKVRNCSTADPRWQYDTPAGNSVSWYLSETQDGCFDTATAKNNVFIQIHGCRLYNLDGHRIISQTASTLASKVAS